eukprot:TRINITY_DN374_c0_g1_i1.p1 TRINITY_DN374_c0_g1~~TRINITY_DN374_c0_g1_i1.p1  ORF type:complete len:1201 (+),score=415.11 TRINITY_DN374_c0_g1_i1:90-3692(+)
MSGDVAEWRRRVRAHPEELLMELRSGAADDVYAAAAGLLFAEATGSATVVGGTFEHVEGLARVLSDGRLLKRAGILDDIAAQLKASAAEGPPGLVAACGLSVANADAAPAIPQDFFNRLADAGKASIAAQLALGVVFALLGTGEAGAGAVVPAGAGAYLVDVLTSVHASAHNIFPVPVLQRLLRDDMRSFLLTLPQFRALSGGGSDLLNDLEASIQPTRAAGSPTQSSAPAPAKPAAPSPTSGGSLAQQLSSNPAACANPAVMAEIFAAGSVTPRDIVDCIVLIKAQGRDYAAFADSLEKHVNKDFTWSDILQAASQKVSAFDVKLFLRIFERAMGRTMNIAVACHPKVSVAILLELAKESPRQVDFQTKRMQDGSANAAGYEAWLSIDFVVQLFSAVQEGDQREAELLQKAIVDGPMQTCPAVLLMSLCEAPPEMISSFNPWMIRSFFIPMLGTVYLEVLKQEPQAIRQALHTNPLMVVEALNTVLESAPQVVRLTLESLDYVSFELLAEHCEFLPLLALLVKEAISMHTAMTVMEWCEQVLLGQRQVHGSVAANLAQVVMIDPDVKRHAPIEWIQKLEQQQEFGGMGMGDDGMMGHPGMDPQNLESGGGHPADNTPMVDFGLGPRNFPPEVEKVGEDVLFTHVLRASGDQQAFERIIQQIRAWRTAGAPEYLAVIHMLYDELRFVRQFPEQVVQPISKLVGRLVLDDLLDKELLGRTQSFLLNTLLSPSATDKEKLFCRETLGAFKARLPEWPMYSQKIQEVPDIEAMVPGLAEVFRGKQSSAAASEANVDQIAGLHQLDISVLQSGKDAKAAPVAAPPPQLLEQLGFLLNNLDMSKMEQKGSEPQVITDIKKLITKSEYFPFISNYFVIKRISLEPNFHRLYQRMFDLVGSKELENAVIQETYEAVRTLLTSKSITTSSSDRSLLKNLGAWIGLQTLGRSKALLGRDLNLKDLLISAMATGKLIAVAPFVSKILEHAANSKVFRPPNPWLMAILEVLVDMHQLPEVKLTLKFEVELLCKALDLNIQELIDTQDPRRIKRRDELTSMWSKLNAQSSSETPGPAPSQQRAGSQPNIPTPENTASALAKREQQWAQQQQQQQRQQREQQQQQQMAANNWQQALQHQMQQQQQQQQQQHVAVTQPQLQAQPISFNGTAAPPPPPLPDNSLWGMQQPPAAAAAAAPPPPPPPPPSDDFLQFD